MSSPAPPDWPAAHPGRRLAAAVIDAFVLLLPCAALAMLHPAAAMAAAVAYGTVLEAGPRRATPGKRACAIEVMPPEGGRLDTGRAALRNLLKYVGVAFAGSVWGLVVPLAVFAPAFTASRQGLHDRAARSSVRHEAGRGLSDLAVAAIALFGPFLLVVGMLPVALSPVLNARARHSVEAAIRGASAREREIEAFVAANGALPPRSAIELQPDGVKGRVILTPEMRGSTVRWRCRGEGIPRGQLPQQCREEL
ncbi:MAG TPA: RDD family protein [Usitatibacter sp.]|jgi:uncharacterized RDD family membrane protein YckC|nr:RDD family protein [Usitatibacter sp.]